MSLDWNAIQENAGGNYKPYAPDGDYIVTVADAETRKANTGTTWLEITFEGDDKYVYPKISHPLSFKNDNWRCWHFMTMLKELGVTEENAKKAIEVCESKPSQEAKISAYEQTFKRAAVKHPKLTLAVGSEEGANGKVYARGDFANSALRMGDRQPKSNTQVAEEMLSQGEEIVIEEDLDLGF